MTAYGDMQALLRVPKKLDALLRVPKKLDAMLRVPKTMTYPYD